MVLLLVAAIAASLALGLLLLLPLLLAVSAARIFRARREWAKQKTGLRMLDGLSPWSGHVNSVVFAEGRAQRQRVSLEGSGGAKTVSCLYGSEPMAITLDLDLIKRMAMDNLEADKMAFHTPMREMEVDCVFTAGGRQWRRIRRTYAQALKSNKFLAPNVQREVDNSIGKLVAAIERKLEAAQGDEIELDVDDYAHRYSLDLVFSCFYKRDDLVDFDARSDPLTELVDAGLDAMQTSWLVRLPTLLPALRPIVDWLILRFHPQGGWRAMIMNLIKQQTRLNLEARKQLLSAGKSPDAEDCFTLQDGTQFRRNMIDHVIDQFHEGKLTKSEYFHSTWFLVAAADKTSSDAIAATLYQLATHSDVQRKLRAAILAEGAECEYLSWVINESIRLLPPAPFGCSRKLSRPYECQDGRVPANTFLLTPLYPIHRLKQYWGSDADQFKPERFARASHFHPAQFMPFGAGARVCPGREFALHETRKLLAELLSRYQFRCEPQQLEYNSPWFVVMLSARHARVRVSSLARAADCMV